MTAKASFLKKKSRGAVPDSRTWNQELKHGFVQLDTRYVLVYCAIHQLHSLLPVTHAGPAVAPDIRSVGMTSVHIEKELLYKASHKDPLRLRSRFALSLSFREAAAAAFQQRIS